MVLALRRSRSEDRTRPEGIACLVFKFSFHGPSPKILQKLSLTHRWCRMVQVSQGDGVTNEFPPNSCSTVVPFTLEKPILVLMFVHSFQWSNRQPLTWKHMEVILV